MPVNLSVPDRSRLLPVAGVTLGVAEAGVRYANRRDLLVMELAPGSTVAGVFTQNRFCAAPVVLCREHLAAGKGIRALVVNTGNANAGTGASGREHARLTCAALAEELGIALEQVLPFSTGVILEPLPVERIIAGLPRRQPADWLDAATAIMTTDTVPKAVSRQVVINGVKVSVTGMTKGSGMIHPNMATMLGFVATDAKVAQPVLQQMLAEVTEHSFNCVTVDGDTSTNDSFILMATGQAGMAEITDMESGEARLLQAAIMEVAVELAQAMARDGEGATKFMSVVVEGGRNRSECKQIAFAIAHSPLVKTAFFASDPNLGRLLAAIGYAGVEDLDTSTLELYLNEVLVAAQGGRHPDYREEDGQRVMKESDITIRVCLHRGEASATVWTCDYSYDYVKINADYRS